MPKTIKNIFDSKVDYIKFYEAHTRASKNKRNRKDIISFEVDLETNVMNLTNSIKNNTYKMGTYHTFIIYEPKERIIQSLPYIDRIVHQWYVEEFIIPYFVPKFINDTYACIKNRGTHKAVDKLQHYMQVMKRNNGSYYILKCDIKKYFYNINKKILLSIMTKYFSDTKFLSFTEKLLYDNSSDDIGIPIGNYTSQYFANIYLNELDHYVKEKLQVKYYVRYMDDFVLLFSSKKEAREKLLLIARFVRERLKLELNSKTKYYPSNFGIDFCGYKVYETHRLVRERSKKKARKLIKEANESYMNNTLNYQHVRMCYNSWKAHVSHANSYNLIRKYHNKFIIKDFL